MKKQSILLGAAGAASGAVNGLFGAGGGMILVPLLSASRALEEAQIFPSSVCVILPICAVSLGITAMDQPIPWADAWPYLIGSAAGGLIAGLVGHKISTLWLHRILGILILWGGIRYLC